MTFPEAFQQAYLNLGLGLSDEDRERARLVAQYVVVSMLEEAASTIDRLVCKACFQMSDPDGLAAAELSAKLVRNLKEKIGETK